MRKMIWVKSEQSARWACSDCAWAFNPTGPPHGASLEEMKLNFERQRNQEFASHICVRYPRTKGKSPER